MRDVSEWNEIVEIWFDGEKKVNATCSNLNCSCTKPKPKKIKSKNKKTEENTFETKVSFAQS